MKRSIAILIAAALLTLLLTGCGETVAERPSDTALPGPETTLLPESMMPDPEDGLVNDQDGIIEPGDNGVTSGTGTSTQGTSGSVTSGTGTSTYGTSGSMTSGSAGAARRSTIR